MPMKELKAYKRVETAAGETVTVTLKVPAEAFCYYDRRMACGMHDCNYTVLVATSSEDIHQDFEVQVRDEKLL